MSIAIMTRVWADSEHKGSELLLLLALADNANDDGVAWPSQETLAAKTRMSVRQVRRLTDTLVAAGSVTIEERRNGRSTRLVYRFPSPGQDVPLNARSPGQNEPIHPDTAMSAEPSVEPRPSVEPDGSTALALIEGGIKKPETAQTLVAEIVDDARALDIPLPKRVIGQLARNIGALLDEGQPIEAVRAGVERMMERRVVQPAMLANFVTEAALASRAPPPRRRYGYGVRSDELEAEARRLEEQGR